MMTPKMMTMVKNKRTPLEQIRLERELLRRDCVKSEERLVEHWDYVKGNVGGLLFNSAVHSVKKKLGFGTSKRKEEDDSDEEHGLLASMGIGSKLMNGLMVSLPFIWEVAQPILMSAVVSKIKSLFGSKKDEDRDDDDRPRRNKKKKKRHFL